MFNFVKGLFYGDDDHADEMAFAMVLGVMVFLFLEVYQVIWLGKTFDPQAFGIGFGSTVGGGAIGMGWKRHLEKDPPTSSGG